MPVHINREVVEQLRQLQDRQDIHDCIVRYCRGVDRLDRDLVLSAYHPDAIDDHGIFVGNPREFVDFFFRFHGERQHSTSHIIGNHFVELDGDTAHCETYWVYAGMNREGVQLTMMGGRYIDRMERRKGRWAIADRICLTDWSGGAGDTGLTPHVLSMLKGSGTNSRDVTDSSYMRPLVIDPKRIASPPQVVLSTNA